ncbi:hypothetical protein C2G38_2168539 [Gigaspora rosea]|uniref:Uncharacterized protein n=1 Tax=Gigaspora rosea TaxID=44941 RepID=A0A397VPJ9_9GLOM|nr:hypothetical protein C2G38_2168539 [Gigaspora rosea]
MAYVERLVSLVGIMVSLAAVTVKELRLERKKYQCLRPRLCYAYRKHGHYACSCTLQVPEKENKNVNRKQKFKPIPAKTNKWKGVRVNAEKNEYKTSVHHQKSSNTSDPDGIGGKIEKKKASDCYLKSAEELGDYHDEVLKDESTASYYYTGDIKNAVRTDNVGCCYQHRNEIKKDEDKVFIYHQRSVDLSNADRTYKDSHCDVNRKTSVLVNTINDEIRQTNDEQFECLPEYGENSLDGEANGLREDRRVQSVEVIVDDACKVIGSPSKNKEAVIIDDLERNLKFDENGIKLDDDSEGEVANGRVEIKSDSIVEDVDDDSETLGKDGHEFSVIKGRGNIGSCDVKAVMKDVERSKLMDQGNLRFRGKGGQIIVSPRAYSRIDMRKIRAKARIDYQKSAETNNADEMSYDRGNSSTERNNPSNCYENGIGGEMAVGNDNVKGYSNNASICDHEFADDSKVDGMIDDERQNDEAMVLMEASLNVVMKMDMMMEGLVEMLRNWGKLNSANEFKINDEKG